PQPPEGSPPGDLGDRKCGIQGQHCRLMATTASTLCIAHPSARLPPGRRMTNHSHYESSVQSRPDSAPGAMQLFMADSSPGALDWERHFRDLHHNFMPPRCQWARLMPLQTAVKARDISNLPLYSGSRDGSSGHFAAAHNEAKR